MKHSSLILYLLTAFILFYSCQKPFSREDEPVNPVLPDSNYLGKMYIIDLNSPTQDTIERWTYTYDNQKRVVRLYDSIFIPATGVHEFRDFQYFYNGNDSLPFKCMFISGDYQPPPDTVLTYFSFDAQGKRIRDSIIGASVLSFGYDGLANYVYSNNKIICNKPDSFFNGTTLSYEYFTRSDTGFLLNNNLARNHYWDVGASSGYHTETVFEYDNHPSPFSKLSNFKAWALLNIEEVYFYEIPQLNNITKFTINEYYNGILSDSYGSDFRGTFIYNTAGYPTQMVDLESNEKIIFVYRTL